MTEYFSSLDLPCLLKPGGLTTWAAGVERDHPLGVQPKSRNLGPALWPRDGHGTSASTGPPLG